MICDYSFWLAFMVAMLRVSDDYLCFEGCERQRIVASHFPEVRGQRIQGFVVSHLA